MTLSDNSIDDEAGRVIEGLPLSDTDRRQIRNYFSGGVIFHLCSLEGWGDISFKPSEQEIALLARTADRYLVQKLRPGYNAVTRKCVYCTADGDRCAIGHEIAPIYSKEMDNLVASVNTLAENFPSVDSFLSPFRSSWLDAVQKCHDLSCEDPDAARESRVFDGETGEFVCVDWSEAALSYFRAAVRRHIAALVGLFDLDRSRFPSVFAPEGGAA